MSSYEGSNLGNMRLCSCSWRSFCDAEVEDVNCHAHVLALALPMLSRLTKLENLIISNPTRTATVINQNALGVLAGQHIKQFHLIGGGKNVGMPQMKVESPSLFLHPWRHCLQSLHLVGCHLLSSAADHTISNPRFFRGFPCLTDLQLKNITATPSLTSLNLSGCLKLKQFICIHGGLASIDLTDCKQLEILGCDHNSLTDLTLIRCDNLKKLSCAQNNLAALDLATCPALTFIDCSNNMLNVLQLSSNNSLIHLCCRTNHLSSLVMPTHALLDGVSCSHNTDVITISNLYRLEWLQCDTSSFASMSSTMSSASLCGLYLEGALTEEFHGFPSLRDLTCSIGPMGSVNLAGCSEVTLRVSTETEDELVLSCSGAVIKLIMSFFCEVHLEDFPALKMLVLRWTRTMSSVNLSVCSTLVSVEIENDSDASDLKEINLKGCTCLKSLHLLDLKSLSELDLSSCMALTDLICFGSSLEVLDASCCPLLVNLNVSESTLLKFLIINSELLCFCSKNCPMLHNRPTSTTSGTRPIPKQKT